MDKFITEAAIENDLAGLTTLRAAERVGDALQAISDGGFLDRGLGMGSCDFWIKIAGKEWLIEMKPSGASNEQ